VGDHRLGIAFLIALVLAAPAAAKRSPTKAESAALHTAFSGFLHMPNSPAAANDKIASIAVASVDKRYAALRLDSKTVGRATLVMHESLGSWWEVGFGSSLGCTTAPKVVLADLGVPCSPPDASAWISNCGPLASAPAELVIACGDGNYYLTGLHWRNWGTAAASATGTAHQNDCKPYCAAGHFHTYPVRVTATKRSRCGAAVYYARLALNYPGRRPPGQRAQTSDSLPC
jgi:hypothetical protein